MKYKSTVMDNAAIDRALARIAHEIIERNGGLADVALIGIVTRGVVLANRLAAILCDYSGQNVPLGQLDITLYRDDLSEIGDRPHLNATSIDFSVVGKRIVLVDDVIYTGRTTRAAMDAVTKLGRPSCIQMVALIDRGHRELPIAPNYVGRNIPTSKDESVAVKLSETDKINAVMLYSLSDLT